jgi:hypothetical protein
MGMGMAGWGRFSWRFHGDILEDVTNYGIDMD